jgi:hypothetical protein
MHFVYVRFARETPEAICFVPDDKTSNRERNPQDEVSEFQAAIFSCRHDSVLPEWMSITGHLLQRPGLEKLAAISFFRSVARVAERSGEAFSRNRFEERVDSPAKEGRDVTGQRQSTALGENAVLSGFKRPVRIKPP